MKKRILAWLLFRANSETKDPAFYEIKNKILSRFGRLVGYDLQEIAGKVCYHCNGTGTCQSFWCDYCGEEMNGECGQCGASG